MRKQANIQSQRRGVSDLDNRVDNDIFLGLSTKQEMENKFQSFQSRSASSHQRRNGIDIKDALTTSPSFKDQTPVCQSLDYVRGKQTPNTPQSLIATQSFSAFFNKRPQELCENQILQRIPSIQNHKCIMEGQQPQPTTLIRSWSTHSNGLQISDIGSLGGIGKMSIYHTPNRKRMNRKGINLIRMKPFTFNGKSVSFLQEQRDWMANEADALRLIQKNENMMSPKASENSSQDLQTNRFTSQSSHQDIFQNNQQSISSNRNMQILRQGLSDVEKELNDQTSPRKILNTSKLNSATLDSLTQFIYDFYSSSNFQQGKNTNNILLPSIDKIFAQFTINKQKLISLPSNQEKINYITTMIHTHCQEQLHSLIARINERAQQNRQLEDIEKRKSVKQHRKDELFSWMKIPCKYNGLKRKLQQSVVDVLYDERNMEKMQVKCQTFRESGHQNKRHSLHLDIEEGNSNRRSGNDIQEKLKNFKWENETERTFISYKKFAQKQAVKQEGMNQWQSIGMQPIIEKLGIEEKLDIYREQLLNKFKQGGKESLSEREKVFIINTSELLNSNIDRKEFQLMIDFIRKEDISQLEQMIADNIILKYETITHELRGIRNSYLRNKANIVADKITANNIKPTVFESIRKDREIKAKQRAFFNFVDRTRRNLEKRADIIDYYYKLRTNPYVLYFIRQLKKAVEQKRLGFFKLNLQQAEYSLSVKRKHNLIQNKNFSQIIQGYHTRSINSINKMYHPTSRILLGLRDLKIEEEKQLRGDMKIMPSDKIQRLKDLEAQRLKIYKYKNRLMDSKKLEQLKDQFVDYYSNGPKNNEQFKILFEAKIKDEYQKSTKPNESETNAVITIQKWIKGLNKAREYKQILSQKRDEQEQQMLNIIQKWKEGKEVLQFIKEQGRIEAIKLLQSQKILKQGTIRNEKYNIGNFETRIYGSVHSNGSMRNSLNEVDKSEQSQVEMNRVNVNSNMTGSQISQSKGKMNKNQENEKEISDSISSYSRHSVMMASGTSTRVGSQQGQDPYSIYDQHMSKIKSRPSISKSVADLQNPAFQISSRKSEVDNFDKIGDFSDKKEGEEKMMEVQTCRVTHKKNNSLGMSWRSSIDKPSPLKKSLLLKMQGNLSDRKSYDWNGSNWKEADKKGINSRNSFNSQMSLNFQGNKIAPPRESVRKHLGYGQNQEQLQQRIEKKNKDEFFLKHKKLISSAKQGNLQSLMNSGFVFYTKDLNIGDEDGNSALYYVTKLGDENFIQYLLSRGADVNFVCSEGDTPLHAIFQQGNIDLIINFIDHGGNLNVVNKKGFTPLGFASFELLSVLGLQNGVANVQPDQPITFDNNKLFNERHSKNQKVQYDEIQEHSSPPFCISRRKEKQPEEELPQQQIAYRYQPISSSVNFNDFTTSNIIKIQKPSFRPSASMPFVQAFTIPQERVLKSEILTVISQESE